MTKLKLATSIVLLSLAITGLSANAADWPPSGAEVMRQEMQKALAEKARRDAIVRQQRALEKQRRLEEQRRRWLEEAERRSRTG